MKAITARYIPATGIQPSRIKATDSDGNQVYVSWEEATAKAKELFSSNDVDYRYHYAVRVLCQKMHWHGFLHAGYLRNSTYVYVWDSEQEVHRLRV